MTACRAAIGLSEGETRTTAQWLGMAVASQPAQVRLPAGANFLGVSPGVAQ
jgi:hypothetical protein